jgi:hypothetical protein
MQKRATPDRTMPREWIRLARCGALGALVFAAASCASFHGQPGYAIEASTGSKTGNPFEIRLTGSGDELRAVFINKSSTEQKLLYDPNIQASALELVPAIGSRPKPYDSRLIKKVDNTPYCYLFMTLAPGKKLVFVSGRFRKTRDGYAGQWGPFNFDEVAPGKYTARVIWTSEREQCFDQSTGKMRKLPGIWKGLVWSNEAELRLP